MHQDFEGTSRAPVVPNFDEFDPAKMDITKMHAICRNKQETAVDGQYSESDLSYQQFVAIFAQLITDNETVEFVLADEEKEFVIIRGDENMHEALIDKVPPELPGQIMPGEDMQKTLVQIKEANKAIQEKAVNNEEYLDPDTLS